MHVAAHFAIGKRNKGLAYEHVAQADAKKRSILIETVRTQCGDVKRIGHKGVCEHGYRRIDLVRTISLNLDSHCFFGRRPLSIALPRAQPDGLLDSRGSGPT